MERQVDLDFGHLMPDGRQVVRWLVCENGLTLDEGNAVLETISGSLDWAGHRPDEFSEGLVRAAIAERIVAIE